MFQKVVLDFETKARKALKEAMAGEGQLPIYIRLPRV